MRERCIGSTRCIFMRELYESSRRKPGWRFTAGVKFDHSIDFQTIFPYTPRYGGAVCSARVAWRPFFGWNNYSPTTNKMIDFLEHHQKMKKTERRTEPEPSQRMKISQRIQISPPELSEWSQNWRKLIMNSHPGSAQRVMKMMIFQNINLKSALEPESIREQ